MNELSLINLIHLIREEKSSFPCEAGNVVLSMPSELSWNVPFSVEKNRKKV
jgi:hypothetical protein